MRRLLALTLLLSPALAFAAGATVDPAGLNSWDVFVMGNGSATAVVLQAISTMVDMPGYRNLALFVAILGIIIMATAAGFDPLAKGPKMLMYFVLAGVVTSLGLNLRANATINDPVSGYYNTVTAPAVVVVPIAMISTTGDWLTRAIEQSFGTFAHFPDELQMSRGGKYGMAAALMADLRAFHVRDPYLKSSLSTYMSQCAFPAIEMGHLSAKKLMETPDFWHAVKSENGAMLVALTLPAAPGADAEPTDPQGELVSCAVAWEKIDAYLTAYVPELANAGGKAWSQTGVFSALAQNLSASSTWLAKGADGAAGLDGGGMIKQAALLNAWTDSNRDAAAQTGSGELQMALAQATAEQSQKNHWVIASKLFQNTIGYVHMLLTSTVMALSPLFLIIMLIPGFGVKSLGSFLKVLIWLALWEPVLAILNYISAAYLQADISTVINAGGITIGNAGAITEFASHAQIAAGFLASLTPLFVWSIVSGGMSFTEFISHGLGAQFATSAGQQAATGNVSLNTQNMDNAAMNSKSYVSSWSDGQKPRDIFHSAGKDNVHFDMGGAETKVNNKQVDNTIKNTEEAKKNLEFAKSNYAAAEKKTTEDVRRAYADTKQWMREQGAGTRADDSNAVIEVMAHRFDQQTADAARAVQARGTTATATAGTNSSTTVAATAGVEAGGGLIGAVAGAFGIQIKGGVSGTIAKGATQGNELATSDSNSNSLEASKTDTVTDTYDKTKTAGKTTTHFSTNSSTMSESQRKELTRTIGQDLSAQAGAREQWSQAEQISQATTLGFAVQAPVAPETHGVMIQQMLHVAESRGVPQGHDITATEQRIEVGRGHVAEQGGPADVVNVSRPDKLKPLTSADDWMRAPEQDATAAVNAGIRATDAARGTGAPTNAAPAPAAPEPNPGAAFDAMFQQNAGVNQQAAGYVEDIRAGWTPDNPWRGDPAQNVPRITPRFKADKP